MNELELRKLYASGLSVNDISIRFGCSMHKIIYWMEKFQIKRRTISDAIYLKHNPNGDPFIVKPIITLKDSQLLGMGLGLYWGEGTKSSVHSVRLGNSDPRLINIFIKFLTDLFGVDKNCLKFGLQIFSDINPQIALRYWANQLGVLPSQFYKITVTISGSLGTYRVKSPYGVLTLHFHNKKLRDILINMLPR